jgi:hypothetical protein
MTSLRVLSAAGAILALGLIAGPVAAAPLGAAATDGRAVAEGASDVSNVHYYGRRSYRGYSGYSGYYGYRWSPPVYSYGYYGSYRPYYSDYYTYPKYRGYYYGGDYGYRSYYAPYRSYYGYRGW